MNQSAPKASEERNCPMLTTVISIPIPLACSFSGNTAPAKAVITPSVAAK